MIRQSGFTGSIVARPAFCRGFRLRSFGYMLRSMVSTLAANMMLVRCNFDAPTSLACLKEASDSPDLRCPAVVNKANHGRGITGTTPLRDLESLRSGRQRVVQHSVDPCSARYPAGKLRLRPRFDGVSPQYGEPSQPSRACAHGALRAGLPCSVITQIAVLANDMSSPTNILIP